MSKIPDVLFPIDDHLMRLEPVVFLENGAYVKTRKGADDDQASFVTARSVVHTLRRLIPRQFLDDRVVRRNAASIRVYLEAELAQAQSGRQGDELRYFVEELLPSFTERDWSTRCALEESTGGNPELSEGDRSRAFDSLFSTIPKALLPTPSVLMLGRIRSLRPVTKTGPGYHVRHGRDLLEPTGSEVTVSLLADAWRAEVRAWLAGSLAKLTECNRGGAESGALARACVQIDREGFFQQGDVLFLPGAPPRVGHVLPPHLNRTLGRDSTRDLAMVVPFTVPPRIVPPQVYTKTSDGRWAPCRLPHGLCLGGSPPDVRPESPGLALLAYLRWAAARIAANGAFHSSDEHHAAAGGCP
jgi:hypothetical protein